MPYDPPPAPQPSSSGGLPAPREGCPASAPPAPPIPPHARYHPIAEAFWRALHFDGPALAQVLVDGSASRLEVLAARAVDLACAGNIKAIGLIADRIEGRVGMRPDEVAPEDEARREDVQAVIESVVTALVNARLAGADDSPEDSASDRTFVVDAEGPRRFAANDPKPRPPTVT